MSKSTNKSIEFDPFSVSEPQVETIVSQIKLLSDEKSKDLNRTENNICLNDVEETVVIVDSAVKKKSPMLISKIDMSSMVINKDVFHIGKNAHFCDLVIKNTYVSNLHADIIRRENTYYIVDCNSTNKTFLNGKILTPQKRYKLSNNSVIKIANLEYEFRC